MDSASRRWRVEDFDLVDRSLLDPPDHPIRGSSRTDAAVVVDRELVRLSGAQARVRLIQARLARRLIDLRGWNDAGFVRLGDFAREVLGISSRTLEDDARVIRALDGLPLLRSLLESGTVVWSRARTLVRVATARNEAALVSQSAAVPLRDLDEFVRQFAQAEAAAGDPSDAPPERTTMSVDGDRRLPDEARGGGRVLRDTTGGPAQLQDPSPGSIDDPIVRWSVKVSRGGQRLWCFAREFASRMAGKDVSNATVLELVAAEASSAAATNPTPESPRWIPPPEFHENRLRSRLHRDDASEKRSLLAFLAETGVAEGFAWLDPRSGQPGPASALDTLLAGLESATARDVTRRWMELRTVARCLEVQMATLLYLGISRRLFREIGFATVRLYVESRLGCCSRTVWSIVALERESWRRSAKLRQAWHDGALTQLQAAELLPVICETNVDAWIEHASTRTLRKLKEDVAWALERATPGARPLPPVEDAARPRAVLLDTAELQKCAYAAPVLSMGGAPPGAVRLEFAVPLSVAVLVETTLDRIQRPGECPWQAFERMVAVALLEWMAQPRHRDPVFDRDGWRCSVPGCTSRRNLHDHHVTFRSQGGGNERDNRTTVCAAHHLHGIHAGRIRATGRAPTEIEWELGCSAGRKPLVRLFGDLVVEWGWAA